MSQIRQVTCQDFGWFCMERPTNTPSHRLSRNQTPAGYTKPLMQSEQRWCNYINNMSAMLTIMAQIYSSGWNWLLNKCGRNMLYLYVKPHSHMVDMDSIWTIMFAANLQTYLTTEWMMSSCLGISKWSERWRLSKHPKSITFQG